jgi:hypothetical protein
MALLFSSQSKAVLKLVIEPVQQLKSAIGQTASTLLRQQPKITIALTDSEISASLMGHAADINYVQGNRDIVVPVCSRRLRPAI